MKVKKSYLFKVQICIKCRLFDRKWGYQLRFIGSDRLVPLEASRGLTLRIKQALFKGPAYSKGKVLPKRTADCTCRHYQNWLIEFNKLKLCIDEN